VVAVTSILGRTRRLGQALRVGAFWGLGHTATLLGVGIAMLLFGVTMPSSAAVAMELVVASMLVLLGVGALRRVRGGEEPAAAQVAARVGLTGRLPSSLRPLAIGLVHGLAGSGALVLLATASIPSRSGAMAYLALFGVGTVLGMTTITLVLAAPFVYGAGRLAAARALIVRGAGGLGILLGLVIAWRVVGAALAP
jgi:high-affinity nickel-transport protein